MKYEVRFIRTQVLDNPIVEAKDEKEAVKLAEKLIHKYDFKDYETTEVVEVEEEDDHSVLGVKEHETEP